MISSPWRTSRTSLALRILRNKIEKGRKELQEIFDCFQNSHILNARIKCTNLIPPCWQKATFNEWILATVTQMPEADGSGFVVISHCDRICRYSLNFANISGIVPISRKLFRPILQNISTIFQKFPEYSRILLELFQYQANYSSQYCRRLIPQNLTNTSFLWAAQSFKMSQIWKIYHSCKMSHRYGRNICVKKSTPVFSGLHWGDNIE